MSAVKADFIPDAGEPVMTTADGVQIKPGSVVYFCLHGVFCEVVIEAVRGGVVWQRVQEQLALVPECLYADLGACARSRGDESGEYVPVRLAWARGLLDAYRAPRSMYVTRVGQRFTLYWPAGWGTRHVRELGTVPAEAAEGRAKLVAWLAEALAQASREGFTHSKDEKA